MTVKEAYIPPFQESSLKVGPDNPATVTVPEGTIMISIPRGAVLAETTLDRETLYGKSPSDPGRCCCRINVIFR